MLKFKKYFKSTLIIISCVLVASTVHASDAPQPPALNSVMGVSLEKGTGEENLDQLQMRITAMKEASLSYGALSGMIHRNWEIYNILQNKEIVLDAVFNFARLTIPTHYGALIEPPIVSESTNAFLLGEEGMTASMTGKTYSINEKC